MRDFRFGIRELGAGAFRGRRIRAPRSAIRTACVLGAALLRLSGLAQGAPNGLSWARMYEEGAQSFRDGDLEEAVRRLRLAVLLNPSHTLAAASLRSAREKLVAERLGEAKRLLGKKQLRPALPLLRSAADVSLQGEAHAEVVRLLRNHGFEEYEGSWRHHEDVIQLEKRALHIARNRRRDLMLSDGFAIHRRARVRIFTDLEPPPGGARVQELLDRLDKAIAAYRELFLLFALDDSWEGLDIVLIAREEDYARQTGSEDTVGIFLPARRASYFALARSSSSSDLVAGRALFHEVCHQLDYKLLRMTHPPPWLQEGTALLFEGLALADDGACVLNGLGEDARRHLVTVCPPGSARWLGLERLVGTHELRPLHGTPAIHDFYAQAGALADFLLLGPGNDVDGPGRRALYYGLVGAARAEGARPKDAAAAFRDLLAASPWTMEEFEKNFVKAVSRLAD